MCACAGLWSLGGVGAWGSLRHFMVAECFVFIAVVVASAIIVPVVMRMIREFPDISDDERKTAQFFTKALKIAIGVLVISGLVLVFVPSKETLIEMMIAKQATYENATWTLDT